MIIRSMAATAAHAPETSMPGSKLRIEPTLLRRINERRLIEALQQHGPQSRATLRRLVGMTAPTVSKAVDSLISRGLLEELDPVRPAVGRPGKLVRMAHRSAIVLGVLIDVETCTVVVAGLDGKIEDSLTRRMPTPNSYAGLIEALEHHGRATLGEAPGAPQGIGVVVNALVNHRTDEVVCCANLPILDQRNPAIDLGQRFGLRGRLIKGTTALCLSERSHGAARGHDDIAVLDMTTGLGLGVIAGGAVVAGHSGMAGEIGHVTVDPNGMRCGCGNRGCLETLATDAALVRMIGRRIGRGIRFDEAKDALSADPAAFAEDVAVVTEHVAIAIAAVVNLFNPTNLFVHSELFAADPGRLADALDRVKRRALTGSLASCTIARSTTTKEQASISAIIHEITHGVRLAVG
ncbi:MAG: ROK family transcriptional regulator [Planctomycetes bacterium]|nr:ROK family transcriptional regulator [Planctomycetota bacterium]